MIALVAVRCRACGRPHACTPAAAATPRPRCPFCGSRNTVTKDPRSTK